MNLLGAILAGGASRRFGADKAMLIVEGLPLWQRQYQLLRSLGAERVVLLRQPYQQAPAGIECWHDGGQGSGPLRGLQAALAPRLARWVAILAVDMPGIDEPWFRWLQESCREGCGAMAYHAEALEPLAAIYPESALGEIEAQLQTGDQSVQKLARRLESVGKMKFLPIPAVHQPKALSLNTPQHMQSWLSPPKTSELRLD